MAEPTHCNTPLKGKHGRVAVKIEDDRGIESLKIVPLI